MLFRSGGAYSWFPGLGPHGELHLIWSQISGVSPFQPGDLVVDAELLGGAVGAKRPLITPAPAPAVSLSFRNLRGFLDSQGRVHFIGTCPNSDDARQRIMSFDGAALHQIYAYEPHNGTLSFGNPPNLLVDAAGHQHVINTPEHSEVACVRDYPFEGGALGDPVNVIELPDGKGTVGNWQAMQLAGGRLCVTAVVSLTGDITGEDCELYVSFSDGGGKWTAPVCVTDNKGRKTSQATEFANGGGVVATTYIPFFASVATARDGHPGVLMVTNAHHLSGVVGGRGVGSWSVSTSTALVDFLKL